MNNLDVDGEIDLDGLTAVAHGDLGVSGCNHGQLLGSHSDSDVSDGDISLDVKDTNVFHSDLDSEFREDEVSEPVVRNILFLLQYFFLIDCWKWLISSEKFAIPSKNQYAFSFTGLLGNWKPNFRLTPYLEGWCPLRGMMEPHLILNFSQKPTKKGMKQLEYPFPSLC